MNHNGMDSASVEFAHSLSDIPRALRLRPLKQHELADFFVETGDARDPYRDRREVVAQQLDSESSAKVLLFGHAGTGKSTELARLQQEHSTKYAFISFSLIDEAQLSNASIEDILVLIVETVTRAIKLNFKIDLDEKTLKSIYCWFSETCKIDEKDLQYTLSIGADASTKDTWWGKLVGLGAYLKSDIRTGSNTIHRSITKDNKRLSELAFQCNLLIKEAGLSVREKLGRELVLIIEDMDKLTLSAADAIFIENPAPLKDLNCKAIYTVPIWLLGNPRCAILEGLFKKVILPMIKVNEEKGGPCEQGRRILFEILEQRIDVENLLEKGKKGAALKLAIEKTGGVLRHLFMVLIEAAGVAETAVRRNKRSKAVITKQDVRYGLDQVKSDLVRKMGVVGLPEEYAGPEVTTEAMRERLADLARRPRCLDSDTVNILLLQAHAILEYNGKGWHGVHPLIAEHLKETT